MPFACPLSLSSLPLYLWFCRFLVSLSVLLPTQTAESASGDHWLFRGLSVFFEQPFSELQSTSHSLACSLIVPPPWPPLCLPPNQLILWILLSVLHVVYVIFDKALFLSSKCFERGALFHIKPKQKRSSKVAGTKRR